MDADVRPTRTVTGVLLNLYKMTHNAQRKYTRMMHHARGLRCSGGCACSPALQGPDHQMVKQHAQHLNDNRFSNGRTI